MPIRPFLAMTAAEIRDISDFPGEIAWMACHFSPYGLGLSNLPASLPPDSLLILNDRTPIHGHDPARIADQLAECITQLGCWGLLLDFQQPVNTESATLVKVLTEALPCPVGVSELYAGDMDCPVFLSPVPPSVPFREHIAPWTGREIWMELALDGEIITLTENGSEITPLPFTDSQEEGFPEESLHCHYKIELEKDAARFTLWRTREDLEKLWNEAKNFGATTAVGLHQELHPITQSKG